MINKAIPVIVKGNKTASMTMDEVAEVPIATSSIVVLAVLFPFPITDIAVVIILQPSLKLY